MKLLQGVGEDYGVLLSKGTFREVDWPSYEVGWLSISSLDPALAWAVWLRSWGLQDTLTTLLILINGNTCPNLLARLKICALKNYPTVLVSGKLSVSSPAVLPTLEAEDPLVFFSLPYNLGLSFSSSSSPSSPESASLRHNLNPPSCHPVPFYAPVPSSSFPTLDHAVCLLHHFSLYSHHHPFWWRCPFPSLSVIISPLLASYLKSW